MHRQPLLSLIQEYSEIHPEEVDTADRFAEFVRQNSDCFERSLEIGHVTGSAWILDSGGTATLLTHHRKLNIWLQTGGHADGDPDALAVAMREAEEETGLRDLEAISPRIFDMDIHGIPERKGEARHYHYDLRFLLRQKGEQKYTVSEESHDLAWVPMNGLEQYTIEASMLRMRDKAVRIEKNLAGGDDYLLKL